MDNELEQLDIKMKEEIKLIKYKYNNLKKTVKKKYKKEKPKVVRITIPKTVKDKLWDDNFGHDAGIGKCYCCQIEINSKKFDCGHIISVAKGGTNNIDNLKPVCSTCNKSMGTKNIEEFKKEYFEKIKNDPIEEKCYYCKDSVKECNYKYESMKYGGVYSVGIGNDEARRIICCGYNKRKINNTKNNNNLYGNMFNTNRQSNKYLSYHGMNINY